MNDELELIEIESRDVDGGWPGDGSGMDDLQDLNQNEMFDYSDE